MLEVIFTGWRKSGHLDLEAVERAVRGAMHRAGAVAVGHLLSQEPSPAKRVACGCGGQARWHSTRPKRLLTAPGPLEFTRAYYVCPGCHQGHSPRDRELDVVGTECSPGVRRMLAWVGSESSFEQGREQLELLAGLEVTAKAVERQAEFIGADLAAREQDQIRRAPQRELPEVCAPAVPVLYLEMDGTGVPVVKQETEDRAGKIEGLVKLLREVPPPAPNSPNSSVTKPITSNATPSACVTPSSAPRASSLAPASSQPAARP